MKKSLLILSLLLMSISAFAQPPELSYHKSVNAFAHKLIAEHIDTICVYENYDEKRDPAHVQYVVWKKNSKTFINKFDKNDSYPAIEFKNDCFWTAFFDNIPIIKSETVEPFGYIAKTNGKDVTFTTVNAATQVKQFKLYVNGDTTAGWFNSYDFLEQAIIKNEIRKNIYFERNNNLKGFMAINMLDKAIAGLEKK